MNRLSFILLVVLAALTVATSTLVAQGDGTKIVFVDAQAAINAHPAGATASTLQEQARTEVNALQTDLQALVEKVNGGTQLTPEEQSRFQQLRTALTDVQQRYAEQINTTVAPALEAVNAIIATIAEESDYDVVMDSVVAGQQPQGINLIIYAKPDLNITQQVVERVRAANP